MTLLQLLFLCIAAEPTPDRSISLRPSAEVSAPVVTLGDLADITSRDDALNLRSVAIGPSPLPGFSRSITLGFIKLRLRKYGFDPDAFAFGDVQEVLLTRVKDAPPCAQAVLSSAGRPAPQFFAAHRISRGQIVRPDDLTIPSPSEPLHPFIGLRATRLIEAGEPVTLAALEPVPAVDRGDLVTLVLDIGSVRLKAIAQVRDPAPVGGLTKVRVLQTNKLLDARVLDSETVSLPGS